MRGSSAEVDLHVQTSGLQRTPVEQAMQFDLIGNGADDLTRG